MQNSKCHLSCIHLENAINELDGWHGVCIVNGHNMKIGDDCLYTESNPTYRLVNNQKGSVSTYQCLLPCQYNKEHGGSGYCTLIEKPKEPGKDTCCLSDTDSPFLFDEQTYNLIRNGGISMTNESNTERNKRVCYELNALYDRKNRDYGDSFHASWKDYGITMAAIRLGDKYNRLHNLTSKAGTVQHVEDESIRDTLMDLANYAIMTVMELDAESKPPKCEWTKEN